MEEEGRTRRFNTAILVGPDGEIAGKYRKIHLPGHADHRPSLPFQHLEKRYFEVGNLGFPVWRAFGGILGMAICNDRRWPETFRVLGLQGVEMVLIGYNTPTFNIYHPEAPHLRTLHNDLSLQSGAYQNGTWVVGVAKGGAEDGHELIAGSIIAAPTGEIVARALTLEDEVVAFDCDLELGAYIKRSVFAFDRHRRPEHYGRIVEQTGGADRGVAPARAAFERRPGRGGEGREPVRRRPPEREGDRGSGRLDDREPERGLEGRLEAGHAGAAEDHHVRSVLVAKAPADAFHALVDLAFAAELGHPESDGEVGRETALDSHRAHLAQVTRDRLRQDGDHPEAIAPGEGGGHRALRDPEHRHPCDLPGGVETGVAVAADDEGARIVVAPVHVVAQGQDHALRVHLGLHPRGPPSMVTHSMAGPAGRRSGSTASLMPSVTARVEFGLITTIGARIGPALRREGAGPPRGPFPSHVCPFAAPARPRPGSGGSAAAIVERRAARASRTGYQGRDIGDRASGTERDMRPAPARGPGLSRWERLP